MGDLFWLSEAQLRRIEPYFPMARWARLVANRRIVSGISS